MPTKMCQDGYINHSNRNDLQCQFGLSVLDILRRSYSEGITSRDVAEQLSYSHSYFCRKFRETFSMGFQQYLGQYRLSKARLFLAQNELSVSEVAEKAGHNSVNFLSGSSTTCTAVLRDNSRKTSRRPFRPDCPLFRTKNGTAAPSHFYILSVICIFSLINQKIYHNFNLNCHTFLPFRVN